MKKEMSEYEITTYPTGWQMPLNSSFEKEWYECGGSAFGINKSCATFLRDIILDIKANRWALFGDGNFSVSNENNNIYDTDALPAYVQEGLLNLIKKAYSKIYVKE